jgi:hypothetical protein
LISEAVSKQTSGIEFGSGASVTAAGHQLPPAITKEITRISQQATVDSTHKALLVGSGFMALALLLSVKLPNARNVEVEQPIAAGH